MNFPCPTCNVTESPNLSQVSFVTQCQSEGEGTKPLHPGMEAEQQQKCLNIQKEREGRVRCGKHPKETRRVDDAEREVKLMSCARSSSLPSVFTLQGVSIFLEQNVLLSLQDGPYGCG